MRKFLLLLVGAFLFLAGCKQEQVSLTPVQQAVKNLTGIGNRYWRLQAVYINDVPQTLTNAQKQYNKTYTIFPDEDSSGFFANSDGFKGVWVMPSPSQLKETITNTGGQPVVLLYTILELSTNKLDFSYEVNNTKTRETYYAF